jgi:AcrR family transcriptional regulator
VRTPSDKKEKIMNAARQLFYEKNFNSVSTDEIAKKASVGKGTIYNYFKSKDDILLQLAKDVFLHFENDIDRSRLESNDFENFIDTLVDLMFNGVKVKSKILFLFHKELHFSKNEYLDIAFGYKNSINLSFETYKNEISINKKFFYNVITNFIMTLYLMSNEIDESGLKSIARKTLLCALKKEEK